MESPAKREMPVRLTQPLTTVPPLGCKTVFVDFDVVAAEVFSLSAYESFAFQPGRSRPSPLACRKCLGEDKIAGRKISGKNRFREVDAQAKCANLIIPLDSGTPLTRSSFYVHLGLQIGLNFVPGFEFRHRGKQIVRARD